MIDFLRSLFFESLLLLLLVEVAALAIAIAVHRRRFTSGSRIGVFVTLAVCVVLLFVQRWVETDRERLEAVVTDMVDAVDDGDVPALARHVDAQFSDRRLDRERWLADVRMRLQRWQIDEARVGGFVVNVDGDEATVSFRAFCDWREGDRAESGVLSFWKLAFVRRDDGWKLSRIVEGKVGPGGLLDYAAIR